jgi:NAD(P)-dependent dehydrogenase (short-subunit alcohol dehydrogenase family)
MGRNDVELNDVTAVVCNVADKKQAAGMVRHAAVSLGRSDIAFNNTGLLGIPVREPVGCRPCQIRDISSTITDNSRGFGTSASEKTPSLHLLSFG